MNGRLHLGHTFTFTKIEFASGYERLKGKTVLFPFGLHCTGMPIKVCADKLKREVELYGSDFGGADIEQLNEKLEDATIEVTASAKKKHSKVASKAGKELYQFQIMQSAGVPKDQIAEFANTDRWLDYFPSRCLDDVRALGCKVDYRRSFITTDRNPYYDSFVRWQFNKLKALGKVKFGERYTIYSPLDGQPCMDHDRQSGEGVGPQEYTCIKLSVQEWSSAAAHDTVLQKAVDGKNVFLVAATLRPETMYGQTNCFVGVGLEYGVFESHIGDQVFICTERAARNMCWQGFSQKKGVHVKLASVLGKALVGTKVHAPLSAYKDVYVLPMDNVLATKGTGIVTSVPSDSPDDYAATQDLAKKPDYYGINPEWIKPFPAVPIIHTSAYGDLAAPTVCQNRKIQSQKDRAQLALAKEEVYKEGFYNGKMLVGEYAGLAVQEAKPKIRDLLVSRDQAFVYNEPEDVVISRSGDECVVNLCDQWYLDYGEEAWRATTEKCLEKLNTFGTETRHNFQKTLAWLNQWACARSFGLGSKLPWDTDYLVESLSDSTVYMAYYTVAHILQGNLDGSVPGTGNIESEKMTDEVWDYIFDLGSKPAACGIADEVLEEMRAEFNFFYPMNLRVSGKDLVPNHLTFSLYNHTALFPETKWPLGIRANGHLLLNGNKMSKSTGNFMTLKDAVEHYGADATRLALADAGDGLEDANFEDSTANAAILRLYTLMEWIKEVVEFKDLLRQGPAESFHDKVFESEMTQLLNEADKAYKSMLYRDALKYGCYEFQSARDRYREATTSENAKMSHDLVFRWIEWQAILLAPFTPHWSESVWRKTLKKSTSIMTAKWPVPEKQPDLHILAASEYVRDTVHRVRENEATIMKKKGKKGARTDYNPDKPKILNLLVALKFPVWQDSAVSVLKSCYEQVQVIKLTLE